MLNSSSSNNSHITGRKVPGDLRGLFLLVCMQLLSIEFFIMIIIQQGKLRRNRFFFLYMCVVNELAAGTTMLIFFLRRARGINFQFTSSLASVSSSETVVSLLALKEMKYQCRLQRKYFWLLYKYFDIKETQKMVAVESLSG